MLGGAGLPRRRRQQQQPRRRQPLLWPMGAEPPPPPWLWTLPGPAGLLGLGAGVAPPPVLLAAAQPPAAPLLSALPAWAAPGEPLLPLLPLPAAPDHAAAAAAAGQPCALLPGQQIFFNNSFALESTWLYPEESRLFLGPEKPHLLANQVAVCLSRPASTVVLAPQPIPDACHTGLQPLSTSPAIAITAATTLVSVEPEDSRGPVPPTVQPCRLLTLAPVQLPLRPRPGPERSRECGRPPATPALVLRTEPKGPAGDQGEKEPSSILVPREDSTARGSKPVASTPVPGSPWCVVWTGDDRVFFFNPSMQLSVWERPGDLQHRGDLNRLLEDPPHKRKLEATATDSGPGAGTADAGEAPSVRSKRNRTDGRASPEPTEVDSQNGDSRTSPQILLPLEERVAHFRDMLLERGVSAFSTWEKELHKIVFDPRYLLLNSEERRQHFEHFAKTRIREEHRERRSKLLAAREGFRRLLEESKVTPRTTFKEFAEKYGRDQRFRLVQKRKDQEHFFNQFILSLRKRDKENRLRLRKMR